MTYQKRLEPNVKYSLTLEINIKGCRQKWGVIGKF